MEPLGPETKRVQSLSKISRERVGPDYPPKGYEYPQLKVEISNSRGNFGSIMRSSAWKALGAHKLRWKHGGETETQSIPS